MRCRGLGRPYPYFVAGGSRLRSPEVRNKRNKVLIGFGSKHAFQAEATPAPKIAISGAARVLLHPSSYPFLESDIRMWSPQKWPYYRTGCPRTGFQGTRRD